MGAVGPASVDVGMAVDAVGVVHQRPLGDETAARGARQGREEVLLARLRTFHVPRPRILELQHQRHADQDHGGGRHARADPPVDSLAGEPVQHEQPGSHQGRQNMEPVSHAADRRVVHRDHALDPRQHDAAQKEHERRPEQRIPHLHRAPVGSIARVPHVRQTEPDHRRHEQSPHRQVEQEHRDVEPVLVGRAGCRLGNADAGEVERVHRQQSEQPEDHPQERLQPGADRRSVAPACGRLCAARARCHLLAPVAAACRCGARDAASNSSSTSLSSARSRRNVTA